MRLRGVSSYSIAILLVLVAPAAEALELSPIRSAPDDQVVELVWSGDLPAGPTRTHYLFRTDDGRATWSLLTSQTTTDPGGSYTDTSATQDSDYEYAVWSDLNGGTTSNYETFSRPFPLFVDPTTGKSVLQLTNTNRFPLAGDNYGLYFEFSNSNRGDQMIFRNITAGGAAGLTYYKLDLKSGAPTALTPTGHCNIGILHTDFLYAACRDSTSGPYTEIRRYPLGLGAAQTICSVTAGTDVTGSLDVNRDASFVVFTETETAGPDLHLQSCTIATGEKTLQFSRPKTETLTHLRFHHTNYNIYYFYNPTLSGLSRIGMGRILENDHANLSSTDPWLSDTTHLFVHPFDDAAGSLWSDVFPNRNSFSNLPFDIVRLTLDGTTNLGNVIAYNRIQGIPANLWQNHFNSGPSDLQFVGDGLGSVSVDCSDSFIHAFTLNPWFSQASSWTPLASGIGTCDNPPPNTADQEANVHYIQAKQWVVWSAYRNLDATLSEGSVDQNLFAVPHVIVFTSGLMGPETVRL
ncbi:MAG: hypothetical protein NXI30_28870, partial [bacterium]|nr:hypothetical protein [bacterium]